MLLARDKSEAAPTPAESRAQLRAIADGAATVIEYYEDETKEFLKNWLMAVLRGYLLNSNPSDRETHQYWKGWATATSRKDACYHKAIRDWWGPMMIASGTSTSRRNYKSNIEKMTFSGPEIQTMWGVRAVGSPRGFPQTISPSKKMFYPLVETHKESYRFSKNPEEREAAEKLNRQRKDEPTQQRNYGAALREIAAAAAKVKDWDRQSPEIVKLLDQQRKATPANVKKKVPMLEMLTWPKFSSRLKALFEAGEIDQANFKTVLSEHNAALKHLQLKEVTVISTEDGDENVYWLLAYLNAGMYKSVEVLMPGSSAPGTSSADDDPEVAEMLADMVSRSRDDVAGGLGPRVIERDEENEEEEDGLDDDGLEPPSPEDIPEGLAHLLSLEVGDLLDLLEQESIDIPDDVDQSCLHDLATLLFTRYVPEEGSKTGGGKGKDSPEGLPKGAKPKVLSRQPPPAPDKGKGGGKGVSLYIEMPDGRRLPPHKSLPKQPQNFSKSEKVVVMNHLYYFIERCGAESKSSTLDFALTVLERSLPGDKSGHFKDRRALTRAQLLELVTRDHMSKFFAIEGLKGSDFSAIDLSALTVRNDYKKDYVVPRDSAKYWPRHEDLALLADPLADHALRD